MNDLLRRGALGLVFLGLHTGLVFHAWSQKGDGAGFYWIPVALADFPLTGVIYVAEEVVGIPVGKTASAVTYLIGGGIQWLLIGAGAQAVLRRLAKVE